MAILRILLRGKIMATRSAIMHRCLCTGKCAQCPKVSGREKATKITHFFPGCKKTKKFNKNIAKNR